MRWAFWRSRPSTPPRALPDDMALPATPRQPAAPQGRDLEGDQPSGRERHPSRTPTVATATPDPPTAADVPLTTPEPDVDRHALATAGADVAGIVDALSAGTEPPVARHQDTGVLAVAATAALAGRLPALAGVDGAAALDEAADELLHAYADLLVSRAQSRALADREDLLAVAQVAAAAAAVDAAAEPTLLLLAGMPADTQLRAVAVLLAQTAADGGGAPDRLDAEVRARFQG